MSIVFVHGVNNRKGPPYDATMKMIAGFLIKHLGGVTIGGKSLANVPNIRFPYWGDLATDFKWNMASLPAGDVQALGGLADINLQPLVAHLRDGLGEQLGPEPLAALAKVSLPLAVDVLTQMALDNVQPGKEDETAAFVVQASAYAEANPAPPWLATVTTDSQLIAQLNQQLATVPDVQALGGFGDFFNGIGVALAKLKQAAKGTIGSAVDKAGDFASTRLLAKTRSPLNAILGRFFGDVFVYLDRRGTKAKPGKIPKVILAALDAASHDAQVANEPLIIVAHSLGGVISMDLLSHFRPNMQVDLFVTVGSQVAHFEEMKLYKASDKDIKAPQKAATPANVRHWINIFDEVDIFSYSVEQVFDRVDVDAPYNTNTYVIKAHSAYFTQDRFYERLRTRIDGL
jgi:hypothetical protein